MRKVRTTCEKGTSQPLQLISCPRLRWRDHRGREVKGVKSGRSFRPPIQNRRELKARMDRATEGVNCKGCRPVVKMSEPVQQPVRSQLTGVKALAQQGMRCPKSQPNAYCTLLQDIQP
jgi:hypothetical protein